MNESFDTLLLEEFNIAFDFDEAKLRRFLLRAGLDLDPVKEQAMYEFGCGKLKDNEFLVNNAGAMFFALNPQRFVKQNYITCVRYKGNSMASVIDRKDLEGDLFSLVDESEEFVKRHTKLAYRFDGFKRIDIEEYPYSAIREAIINAVCHRDYFLQNNVFINVFDDKVEVISPGGIPNDLNLKQVYGASNPRNYLIVELFKKAKYIEKLGSGLKRMDELMLIHGLKKPVYNVNNSFFKVTFLGPKEKIMELVKPSNETDLHKEGLNERQVKILNYLQAKHEVSSAQYQELTGATERTAQRDIKLLLKKGFVTKNRTGKNTHYRIN